MPLCRLFYKFSQVLKQRQNASAGALPLQRTASVTAGLKCAPETSRRASVELWHLQSFAKENSGHKSSILNPEVSRLAGYIIWTLDPITTLLKYRFYQIFACKGIQPDARTGASTLKLFHDTQNRLLLYHIILHRPHPPPQRWQPWWGGVANQKVLPRCCFVDLHLSPPSWSPQKWSR